MISAEAVGVAYALAVGASLLAWRRDRRELVDVDGRRARSSFWLLVAIVLVSMVVARYSGIAQVATDTGRDLAKDEGWYANRRPIQAKVILALLSVWILVLLIAALRMLRNSVTRQLTGALVISLILLAIVRSVSLHAVDAVAGKKWYADLSIGSTIEICGLVLVAVLAAVSRPPRRSSRKAKNETFTPPDAVGDHAANNSRGGREHAAPVRTRRAR